MRYLQFFLLAGLVLHITACDRTSQISQIPKLYDYDECVLQNMQNISSDIAARAIQKSCKAQSRSISNQDSVLPVEAINRLDGTGSAFTDNFGGKIYNGNNEWIITQVTIVLAQKKKEDDLETIAGKQYTSNVIIDPLTAESFSFSIVNQHLEYDWGIVSARGIKLP